MQIFATGIMVKLFQLKNFAIGAGLAKSEALVAAVLGTLFFGSQLSLLGWLGVLLGGIAIVLMSSRQGIKELSLSTALLGLLCGTGFALTSLWIREASLCLTLPYLHRAAWVLVFVINIQAVALIIWLIATDRQTLKALFQRFKLTLLISVSSCLGSIGWFSAMSIQEVPYVKTLGQIEIFFTLVIAMCWLKQPVKHKDILALVLIAIASVIVIWG